jgi:soluble lytic murein transglycosylase-like protein
MQLMPKTAQLMQKDMNKGNAFGAVFGNAAEPVMNVTLGQNYVRRLLDNELVEGNLFYMLAAYNAGPGRLQEWKTNLNYHSDPLLFAESIPIAQTRHYVMQVMTNYWIYCELADKPSNSVYTLLRGNWPSYDETSWPVAEASFQPNG